MKKYLIFRTDRIGDFLLTSILINSIKRNDPYSHISIVASEKNYNYIKTFGEMTLKEKNNISHRKVAITKLKSFLF